MSELKEMHEAYEKLNEAYSEKCRETVRMSKIIEDLKWQISGELSLDLEIKLEFREILSKSKL